MGFVFGACGFGVGLGAPLGLNVDVFRTSFVVFLGPAEHIGRKTPRASDTQYTRVAHRYGQLATVVNMGLCAIRSIAVQVHKASKRDDSVAVVVFLKGPRWWGGEVVHWRGGGVATD